MNRQFPARPLLKHRPKRVAAADPLDPVRPKKKADASKSSSESKQSEESKAETESGAEDPLKSVVDEVCGAGPGTGGGRAALGVGMALDGGVARAVGPARFGAFSRERNGGPSGAMRECVRGMCGPEARAPSAKPWRRRLRVICTARHSGLATGVHRVRRDQKALGPAALHTGRGWSPLSSGCDTSGYH